MNMLKRLAEEAIEVQSACNGLAVAKRYGEVILELRDLLVTLGEPTDTDALRKHPINRLWASKIHDLAGLGLSDVMTYTRAYHWCQDQVEGKDESSKQGQ